MDSRLCTPPACCRRLLPMIQQAPSTDWMHLSLGILSGSIKTLSPLGGCSRREEMLLSTVYGFHCFPSCYFIEGWNPRCSLYSLFKANCKNSTPKFFPDNVTPEIKIQKHAGVLPSTVYIIRSLYSRFTDLSSAGSSSPTSAPGAGWHTPRWHTLSPPPPISVGAAVSSL